MFPNRLPHGGMKSTVLELNTKATSVAVHGEEVAITLADGRRVTFPWTANRRLREAAPSQRANVTLICGGTGLSWMRISASSASSKAASETPGPPETRNAASVQRMGAF